MPDKDDELPPDQFVAKKIEDGSKKLTDLQKKLESVRPPSGPSPAPSGGPSKIIRTAEMVEDEKRRINAEKKNVFRETFGQSDSVLQNAPRDIQIQAYKDLYDWEGKNKTPEIEKSDLIDGKKQPLDSVTDGQKRAYEILDQSIEAKKEAVDSKSPEVKIQEPVVKDDIDLKIENLKSSYDMKITINIDTPDPPSPNETIETRGKEWMENKEDL